MEAPKTKEMVSLLAALGLSESKVLLLSANGEENIALSARNLPKVKVRSTCGTTSLVDVLGTDYIVCTRGAWADMTLRVEGKGAEDASTSEEVAAHEQAVIRNP